MPAGPPTKRPADAWEDGSGQGPQCATRSIVAGPAAVRNAIARAGQGPARFVPHHPRKGHTAYTSLHPGLVGQPIPLPRKPAQPAQSAQRTGQPQQNRVVHGADAWAGWPHWRRNRPTNRPTNRPEQTENVQAWADWAGWAGRQRGVARAALRSTLGFQPGATDTPARSEPSTTILRATRLESRVRR